MIAFLDVDGGPLPDRYEGAYVCLPMRMECRECGEQWTRWPPGNVALPRLRLVWSNPEPQAG